jgi:hypothetical protein
MWCAVMCAFPAAAVTVSEKAKESGCVNKPIFVSGTRGLYRCRTESGDSSYFNVPGSEAEVQDKADHRISTSTAPPPSPAGFPRVDSATQKGRDDMRRKVLSDELATEEKLLSEARTAYAGGAPNALPEERSDVEKYRTRIGKLREAVNVHERNVEALKKELSASK